jgi:hypothetical protein
LCQGKDASKVFPFFASPPVKCNGEYVALLILFLYCYL